MKYHLWKKMIKMSEWKEYKLGNVAEVQTGPFGSQLHMSDYKTIGTPIITVEHLGENKILYNNLPLVGDEDKQRLIKYTLREGDIVFSRVGSVDRRAYVSNYEDGWMFSGRCLRVRTDKKKANPRFLSFYFGQESFKETVRRIAVGATMPSINTTILSEIKIKIPHLNYQIAIAEILSSLDDKIDLLHRQNKTLELLAETLFRQWFVEEVNDSYEVVSIVDVCERINSGGTPPTRNEAYYNGDINWYSTKELNDKFLFESNSKITKEGLENSSAKLFPENTIVIAIYAAPTVGRLGILGNEGAFNQAACGFIANEEIICFEYLYFHLYISRQKLNEMASGSAQQNLNVGIIKAFEILLPPRDLMQKFKEQVKPIFQKIKSHTKQIHTLTQLRDTLLPKLMSGEVRVGK
jgi:type I restriction enzyme S subunit